MDQVDEVDEEEVEERFVKGEKEYWGNYWRYV
jgi:hypothetical protein